MWEIDLLDQLTAFFLSILIGLFLGLVFYTLTAFYKAFCITGLWQIVSDVVFFAFAGFLTFCFLLITTNGELRAFVLVGELIGFLLFKVLFSRVLCFLLELILGGIRKGVLCFFGALSRFSRKISEKSRKILKKLASLDKKVLKKEE